MISYLVSWYIVYCFVEPVGAWSEPLGKGLKNPQLLSPCWVLCWRCASSLYTQLDSVPMGLWETHFVWIMRTGRTRFISNEIPHMLIIRSRSCGLKQMVLGGGVQIQRAGPRGLSTAVKTQPLQVHSPSWLQSPEVAVSSDFSSAPASSVNWTEERHSASPPQPQLKLWGWWWLAPATHCWEAVETISLEPHVLSVVSLTVPQHTK